MIDYHIHSTYSFDGKSPLSAYVGTAQRCGLREIGFAEHVDLDSTLKEYNFLNFPLYKEAVGELEKNAPIPVRCGLEISYQQHLEGQIKEYLMAADCDFVIGSVHEVEGVTMDHRFFEQFNPLQYFRTVEALITSESCDIVGHLEYFKRWGGSYTSSAYKNEISALLQLIIEKDIVLEVNTSGLRHAAQDTYPSLEVVQWYRELGGELISLGSDAHTVKDTAFKFPPVLRKLKSLGFDSITAFEKRVRENVSLV